MNNELKRTALFSFVFLATSQPLVVFDISSSNVSSHISEVENITMLKEAMVNATNHDPELIPNWAQLVFHACVGGCDGCINLSDPDNKGLLGTYEHIKSLHSNCYNAGISLADFVVVAGTVAVEQALRADGSVIQDITILLGRKTCQNPANPNKTAHLPSGNDPFAFQDLMAEFNITSNDAVALMGAHSLGRTRSENSGFEGHWDITEFSLDNGYYRSMHHTNWTRTEIVPGKYQWISPHPNDTRMMLPSDMYLIADVTNLLCQHTITVSCKRSELYRQSRRYMTDQMLFHDDFRSAFSKMVNNTVEELRLPV